MNKLHIFFAFFTILSSVIFFSEVFAFSCTVRSGSCTFLEVCLFSLYQPTNSHLADCSTYNYKVCCDFTSSALRTTCYSNETGVISLNKITNSHAEIYGPFSYGNHVCVNESLGCTLRTSCMAEEVCIASFYRDLSSHAGECYYYSNKLCCKSFKPYTVQGIVLSYSTGLPIPSGTITGIIRETGERAYSSISGDGLFLLKFNTTVNSTVNKFTLSLIINGSDNRMGYVQLVAGSGEFVSGVQICSVKEWHFTGRAIDNSGVSISSGNVMISVQSEAETFTNSTTFSNGIWDIYISPCLISGNLYTFQVTISSGDQISSLAINQIAK